MLRENNFQNYFLKGKIRQIFTAALSFLLFTFIFSSCLSVKESLTATNSEQLLNYKKHSYSDKWFEVLMQHSRGAESWKAFWKRGDLRATLVTPRLKSSFLAEKNRFGGQIARDMKRDFLGISKFETPQNLNFESKVKEVDAKEFEAEEIIIYAAFYAPESAFRELNQKFGAWSIFLKRGNRQVEVTTIDEKDVNLSLRDLFPYVDRYDRFYVLHFPAVDKEKNKSFWEGAADEPLELELVSAQGRLKTSWYLKN